MPLRRRPAFWRKKPKHTKHSSRPRARGSMYHRIISPRLADAVVPCVFSTTISTVPTQARGARWLRRVVACVCACGKQQHNNLTQQPLPGTVRARGESVAIKGPQSLANRLLCAFRCCRRPFTHKHHHATTNHKLYHRLEDQNCSVTGLRL